MGPDAREKNRQAWRANTSGGGAGAAGGEGAGAAEAAQAKMEELKEREAGIDQ